MQPQGTRSPQESRPRPRPLNAPPRKSRPAPSAPGPAPRRPPRPQGGRPAPERAARAPAGNGSQFARALPSLPGAPTAPGLAQRPAAASPQRHFFRDGGGGGRAESGPRSSGFGLPRRVQDRLLTHPGSLDQDACKARGSGLEGQRSPVRATDRPFPSPAHTLSPGVIPAGWAARAARGLVPGESAGELLGLVPRRHPETRAPPPAAPKRHPRPRRPRPRSSVRQPRELGRERRARPRGLPWGPDAGRAVAKGKPKEAQASRASRREESRSHCRATRNTAARAAPF